MTIRDKIRPFTIVDYEVGGTLTLYSVEDYKQEIFDTRKDEGFTGNAYDWIMLAEAFARDNMPDVLDDIAFEPESDILTVYADDSVLLESFAMQFKQALDNDEYIYPLFKSLEREKRAVPENISVRKASAEDAVTAAELACKMWRDASAEELTESLSRIISGDSGAVFILEADGADVGFAQCQLRNDYVEGTESSPVGYLEGVYIEPLYRRNGGASALLEMCEIWAREQGCTEFASDCEADNEASRLFHLGAGFTEANRIICFTKKL